MLLNRIKLVRQHYGLTQEDLAKLSGSTQNTISSIETYKYFPSAYTAYKICKALNCTFEQLFYTLED